MSGGMREHKRLRACVLCSLLKPESSFRQDGCENCEDVMQMRGDMERVRDCTSALYQGTVAMIRPAESWVAKWQRVSEYCPGLYAIKVYGMPPDDVLNRLEAKGIPYIPRDGTTGTQMA